MYQTRGGLKPDTWPQDDPSFISGAMEHLSISWWMSFAQMVRLAYQTK
jgi:hypothetical protein